MVCANCGSEHARTYTRTIDGKETILVLCRDCYEKLYPERDEGDFFATFVGEWDGAKACPTCGTTLNDFRATGLLGCAYCYTAFRDELLPAVRRMQGRTVHEGSGPNRRAEENYDDVLKLVHEKEVLESSLSRAMSLGDERDERRIRERLAAVNRKLYGGEDA